MRALRLRSGRPVLRRWVSTEADAPALHSGELQMQRHSNGCVEYILNRPKKLNALSLDQAITMSRHLPLLDQDPQCSMVLVCGAGQKAFCAGGDIDRIVNESDSGWNLRWFATEYRMNYRIAKFQKPYVAMWRGIVMGGGVGVSIFGSYRVATENTLFAMPETGIGFFPDVGASYFLPRLSAPGLGLFLGLTGHRCNGADALHQGIATHFVPLDAVEEVTAALANTNFEADAHSTVRTVLENFRGEPQAAPTLNDRCLENVAKYFGAPESLEHLLDTLEADADTSSFAGKTLRLLRSKCPMSCAVAFRQLRRGRDLSLAECLQMEYQLAASFTHVDNYNMREGVRCTLHDKDSKPEYRPRSIEAVTTDELDTIFLGVPGDMLDLE
eukprot:CAMPEP_0204276394 /NCGR_PEP_ID=MMETSP0468-20130131/28035_1 /ASSEMBLY_ACC=CAM_ASM_000383 /TAXON_ID=2969 /ORGANISM="Oxyrrhis marina" /LENGTH=384 /DNA_ID=CAMNT_0051252989 /DNA_START=24 /DNA_END=1178 /DNA_ORIENTATION=+